MSSSDCGNGFGGSSLVPDPELVNQGWELRNLSDPTKAREASSLYHSLGFEVLERPALPENFGPDCGVCASEACQTYVLLYVREKKDGNH